MNILLLQITDSELPSGFARTKSPMLPNSRKHANSTDPLRETTILPLREPSQFQGWKALVEPSTRLLFNSGIRGKWTMKPLKKYAVSTQKSSKISDIAPTMIQEKTSKRQLPPTTCQKVGLLMPLASSKWEPCVKDRRSQQCWETGSTKRSKETTRWCYVSLALRKRTDYWEESNRWASVQQRATKHWGFKTNV